MIYIYSSRVRVTPSPHPKVHYPVGKRENSKAEIGMSFGLSPSLRFRTRNRFPFSFLFHDVSIFRIRARRIQRRLEFKERSARERETDFERFPEVGGKKLKALQAGTADSEFSRWGHERGGADAVRSFRDCLPLLAGI